MNQSQYELNESLIEAVRNEDIDSVKMLLDSGADIHYRNDCIIRWSKYGHGNEDKKLEIIKYLVARGANVRALGDNIVHWAIDFSYWNIVAYLIELDPNFCLQDNIGLHYAFKNNNFRKMEFLIKRGADIGTLIKLDKTMDQNIRSLKRRLKKLVTEDDIRLAYITAQSKQMNGIV